MEACKRLPCGWSFWNQHLPCQIIGKSIAACIWVLGFTKFDLMISNDQVLRITLEW